MSSARWSKEAKEGDGGGSSSLSLTSSSAFCRSLDASIWDSSKSSPGETKGEGGIKGITQFSTLILPSLASKPPSTWVLELQALGFTPCITLWAEWDTRHSSPQAERCLMRKSPATRGKGTEGNLEQTPGPWHPLLASLPPHLAGDSTKPGALLGPPSWSRGSTHSLRPAVRDCLKGGDPP